MGHGDYNENLGFEPKYIVWALINGEIQVSPVGEWGEDGRDTVGTHGSIWGHGITDETFKGRYEPETGRVSIVRPSSRPYVNISAITQMLRNKLGPINEVIDF